MSVVADMSASESRIKEAREAIGMTQEKLATTMGVTVGTVSRWERGMGLNARRIAKLARVLKKPSDWLLPDEVEAPSSPQPGEPAPTMLGEPRVDYGDDAKKAAIKWLDAYLSLKGFVRDTERWSVARDRVLRAAGDRGPTPELAEEIISLIVAIEQGKASPSAQTVRSQSEADRDARRGALESQGRMTQPKNRPPKK